MNKRRKVITVFGTRPEAIKMAPVIKELQKFPEEIETVVAVTAQHRQMLDQVLELFDIVPHYDLNIMQERQSLFDITTRVLTGLGEVFTKERPDLVLVHGDTTTTFAASLAAFYLQIPVGHVEAGLRTRNKYSPFPEEMNRRLTGALADLHFAPTATARENLLREGVPPQQIWVTGNTVIDALMATVREDYCFGEELAEVPLDEGRLLLVTTHRRENWGEPLREVYLALRDLLEAFPDVRIVFPVHKNPRVREVVEEVLGEYSVNGAWWHNGEAGDAVQGQAQEAVWPAAKMAQTAVGSVCAGEAAGKVILPEPEAQERAGSGLGREVNPASFSPYLGPKASGAGRVHLIEPLDYAPFANLMNKATLVLTDSGGLQEEAPSLGKPVLVLRDTTERPEAVIAGTVRLVGTRRQVVFENARELLSDAAAYEAMAKATNPYGDGKAAQRIVLALRRYFGFTEEPWEEFKSGVI